MLRVVAPFPPAAYSEALRLRWFLSLSLCLFPKTSLAPFLTVFDQFFSVYSFVYFSQIGQRPNCPKLLLRSYLTSHIFYLAYTFTQHRFPRNNIFIGTNIALMLAQLQPTGILGQSFESESFEEAFFFSLISSIFHFSVFFSFKKYSLRVRHPPSPLSFSPFSP